MDLIPVIKSYYTLLDLIPEWKNYIGSYSEYIGSYSGFLEFHFSQTDLIPNILDRSQNILDLIPNILDLIPNLSALKMKVHCFDKRNNHWDAGVRSNFGRYFEIFGIRSN